MVNSRHRRVAWTLILVGALTVAVFTFVAARAASAANDAWQESVRAETRHTSSTVENIRALYQDEAPMALLIRTALIRAEELERQASPTGQGAFVRTVATAERATARAYVNQFRKNAPDSPINDLVTAGGDPAGATAVQRIGRRLAALQEQSGQHAVASAALQKVGDQSAKRTQRSAIGMIAGALVALLGFLLWFRTTRPSTTPGRYLAELMVATTDAVRATLLRKAERRRRGPFTHPVGILVPVVLAVGAAVGILLRDAWTAIKPPHQAPPPDTTGAPAAVIGAPALPTTPPEGPPKQSRSPLPAVIFAVLATAATALQITAGTEENHYLAEAARGAATVGAVAVGSGPREAFATNGQQSVVLMQQRASDLTDAGRDDVPSNRALASALATADNAAAPRISAVVADMATPPTAADGVDALARAAVSSSEFDREPLQRAQADAAAFAKQAGNRSTRLVIVLFLLTLAANAVEIGNSPRLGTWRRHLTVVGWVLCVTAVLLTAYALR